MEEIDVITLSWLITYYRIRYRNVDIQLSAIPTQTSKKFKSSEMEFMKDIVRSTKLPKCNERVIQRKVQIILLQSCQFGKTATHGKLIVLVSGLLHTWRFWEGILYCTCKRKWKKWEFLWKGRNPSGKMSKSTTCKNI